MQTKEYALKATEKQNLNKDNIFFVYKYHESLPKPLDIIKQNYHYLQLDPEFVNYFLWINL